MLRKQSPAEVAVERARERESKRAPRRVDPPEIRDLTVGRFSDNECILFEEARQLSWIVYPPRSRYSFLNRSAADLTVVEVHFWSPSLPAQFHELSLVNGCSEHGAECEALAAVRMSTGFGYDPFS